MHIEFGGEAGKKVHPLIVNIFAIGLILLTWAATAYIIDLIVQSA